MLLAAVATTGCKNSEQEFPDFEGGKTVYFPYQYPVRTILLGSGVEFNNDLDNAHKFQVMGYGASTYDSYNFTFNVTVDASLCNDVTFSNGTPVKALPQDYYQILNNTSNYVGNRMSAVEVQLTDKFFQDPAACTTTYVLPLRMSNVQGAQQILESQDFTLYCVRFVNPWEGFYLVKGSADQIEKCVIVQTVTTSNKTCSYTNIDGATLELKFDGEAEDSSCSIMSGDTKVGDGKFVRNGEANSWGNKDRNALYLKYTVDGKAYDETLVLQRRGSFAGTVVEFK